MEAEQGIFANPELWVGVAFLIFIGIVLYYKLPGQIAKSLDARAGKIRDEIEEARKLKEEAQALLAKYQRQQRNADAEAKAIVDQAREEAKHISKEARAAASKLIERRTRAAEEKIAQAEVQAINEVEQAAAGLAVDAAEKILRATLDTRKAEELVSESIKSLRKSIN